MQKYLECEAVICAYRLYIFIAYSFADGHSQGHNISQLRKGSRKKSFSHSGLKYNEIARN